MKLTFLLFVLLFISACSSLQGPYEYIPDDLFKYKITFDINNASAVGSMPAQIIATGKTVKLNSCGYTLTDKTCVGWATSPNGSLEYLDGASYEMGIADVTLYAYYAMTVTYDGNGNTAGTVPIDNNFYPAPQLVYLPGNTGDLIKFNSTEGFYKFAGWSDTPSGQPLSTSFTIDKSLTLYAVWISYELRKAGPAGGLIFYDKGSYSDGWRYMEAAPSDEPISKWSEKVTAPSVPLSQNPSIGAGRTNTLAIINADSSSGYAAKLCYQKSLSSNNITYSNWFLSSESELGKMYDNLKSSEIGNFVDDFYWSSTENNVNNAIALQFADNPASVNYSTKTLFQHNVRCARQF